MRALRHLARRYRSLDAEIAELDIEYSVTSTLNVESTILERRVFPFVVKPVPVVGPVDPCSA